MNQFIMRYPCKFCRGQHGVERTKNGQRPVYCAGCGKYAGYLRPLSESGTAPRSTSTSHSIKPRQRSRILERDGRCLTCGKLPVDLVLHVSHIVSVKEALDAGFDEADFNADSNLFTECEECNLGRGSRTIDYHTLLRLISLLRLSVEDSEAVQALWKGVQAHLNMEAAQ